MKEITMTKLQPCLVEELSLKNLTITEAIKDGSVAFVGPPASANMATKTLHRNRISGGTVAAHKIMSATRQTTPPDFDEDILQAIDEWRKKIKLGMMIRFYLLVEMFRIHQKHWDACVSARCLRWTEFRSDVAVLSGSDQNIPGKAGGIDRGAGAQPASCRPKQFLCRRLRRRHRSLGGFSSVN